jgi:hypothetical protein
VALQLEILQGFDGGGQTTVPPRLQVPAPSQVSPDVQAFWSLHAVPDGAKGFEHCPETGLQVPTRKHSPSDVQVTGFPPVQTPLWQVSVRVQALPSLQLVPSALLGFEQTPVVVLQVPTSWH